jgi:uncharacterized protein YjiS (DUF1127 family)
MIMSTISNVVPQTGEQAGSGGVFALLRRWWMAYLEWRLHHLAATQLHAMTDRELKDIGLSRSEIEAALRGDHQRDHNIVRYY